MGQTPDRIGRTWLLLVVTAMVISSVIARADAPATQPATRPASTLTDQQLRRGRALRTVLSAVMERAFGGDGTWPEMIDQPEGTAPLTYLRPEKVDDPAVADHLSWGTAVLHEPLEQFPDGVWVAYASGTMEFVRDAGTLEACKRQVEIIRQTLAQYGSVVGPDLPTGVTPIAGELRLRVVDPEGQPVEGAMVGVFATYGNRYENTPFVRFADADVRMTDANGELVVRADEAFREPFRFSESEVAPLNVLHRERRLVAVEEVRRSEFGQDNVREIRLQEACHVVGHLTLLGLPDDRHRPRSSHAFVVEMGRWHMRSAGSDERGGYFDFLLPPGEYCVAFSTADGYSGGRLIQIEPGQERLTLDIDVPPDALAMLRGKPAPELRQIKEWKNGGPVTLAELRGNVVMLDFWGYWCGPCIGQMPYLMKLHDEYADKGLVVIAVHDDSVESIQEMDRLLADVRLNDWKGRDLPFLIALDGGGETRVAGTSMRARGATTAAYGISGFPTTVLIDRNGNLVGEIGLTAEKDRAEIERLLAEKPLPR